MVDDKKIKDEMMNDDELDSISGGHSGTGGDEGTEINEDYKNYSIENPFAKNDPNSIDISIDHSGLG